MTTLPPPAVTVEKVTAFQRTDLADLCDAAGAAIEVGGGFGWIKPPPRHLFESYWKGVLLVPERHLFIARLDGVVAGAAQFSRLPRNNEAQAFAGTLMHHFVAPWARGHGLARSLVLAVEDAARAGGTEILNLDIRATQTAAIHLYEGLGDQRWGEHPYYAKVDGELVRGLYFYKFLNGAPERGAEQSGDAS